MHYRATNSSAHSDGVAVTASMRLTGGGRAGMLKKKGKKMGEVSENLRKISSMNLTQAE